LELARIAAALTKYNLSKSFNWNPISISTYLSNYHKFNIEMRERENHVWPRNIQSFSNSATSSAD